MVLSRILLLSLLGILLLILNLALFSRREISQSFRTISKRTWILLLLIFLVGAGLRVLVVPGLHQLYYDEDGYLDIAKNLAERGSNCLCLLREESCQFCGFSSKSIGFTPPLRPPFLGFGVSESLAFGFVKLLGSLSVLALFFFAFLLFQKEM